jgi:hypothetical protein
MAGFGGLESVDTSGVEAGFEGLESVDTPGVVAGFGGHTLGRPPRSRTGIPAAFRYALAVSRRTVVVSSIRRSDHPSRPSARTCCCLLSPKTLLMAAKEHAFPAGVNVSAATCGGRFSGVDQWPVLGVHRGYVLAASPQADAGSFE